MRKKIQQPCLFGFVTADTKTPEHGCRIKTEHFFGWQIDTLVGQVMIFLMVKKNRFKLSE